MRDPIITSRQIQHPSPDIQEQGLALMRNYICDGHEVEITHLLEGMGEEELFSSLLSPKLYPDAEIEPMEQVGMRISFERRTGLLIMDSPGAVCYFQYRAGQ
jgi:hypothetical protein